MKKFLVSLLVCLTLVGAFSTMELTAPNESKADTVFPLLDTPQFMGWVAQVRECDALATKYGRDFSDPQRQNFMEECMEINGY
ncbi:MAG: hypothetical protein GY765_37805 [bacterium]|nr:hypothetical protein [bacterium]